MADPIEVQVGWYCAGPSGRNPILEALDHSCTNPLRIPVYIRVEPAELPKVLRNRES